MRDAIGAIDYVRAHLEEALATDGRVSELGLEVAVDQDELVVIGRVATPARRLAVDAVAREVAPGFAVRNETLVVRLCEPDGEETVE